MQNVCVGEKHARFFQYNNSDLLHEVNKVLMLMKTTWLFI